MSLTRILRAMGEPLLVEPVFGARLVSIFGRHLAGERFNGAALHAELGIGEQDPARAKRVERIAVIPVVGVIAQRPQSLGTSTEEIGAMVDAAVADPKISAILYDHDSPGGTVSGVPETAAKIRAAAKVKPSLAIANGLSASASYWLAAAAGEIWATPSGEAGSIGVWTAHEDWSKYLEREGVKVTEIAAGEFKTETAPWKPLTEEGREFIEAQVREVYGWFIRDVALDRRATQTAVREGFGRGRVLMARDSEREGLVDRIGTFEEAIGRLSARVKAKARARADLNRARIELDIAAVRSNI